ncbi:MAG TPA: acyltransferase [Phycisphaerales bacterium]|nr:acyltransferase [Phycisphaerales bacterium]
MEPSPPTPDRDPAWDLARGIGVLCVIAAHSAGPYVARPLPGLLWPVYEPVRGLWEYEAPRGNGPGVTDLVFWIIRAFTVPMFFFIAGVFTARALGQSAPGAFARSRAGRLGWTLLAAYFLVMPLVYVIWTWGWVRYGYAAWEHLLHFHFGPAVQQNFHGFGHLWYLWYLLLISVAAAGVHRPWPRALKPATAFGPAFLAICALAPVAALLPTAVARFENGYIPRVGFMVFHAVFFAWGCRMSGALLAPGSRPRRVWGALSPLLIITGVVCVVAMVRTLAPALHILQNQPPPVTLSTEAAWIVGACAAVAGVTLAMGVIGACLRWADAGRPSTAIAALGRASLWVYVTHLPWVGLSAVALYSLPLPGELKACVAFVFALEMSLLSRRLIAGTRVGQWLGA